MSYSSNYPMLPTDRDPEKIQQAWRSVNEMKRMLPMLTGFARAALGSNDVRMEITEGTPCVSPIPSGGYVIKLRPPMALGKTRVHERHRCGQRDSESSAMLCPACRDMDEVMSTVFHEMAHISAGSFDDLKEKDKVQIIEKIVAKWKNKDDGTRKRKIADGIETMPEYAKNYFGVTQFISPWLPILINAIEDSRVNRHMYSARSGTRAMFRAKAVQVFTEGVEQPDLTVKQWRDYEPNIQVCVGIYAKTSDFEYEDWFAPAIVDALNDPEIHRLSRGITTARTPASVFRMALPMLERLRELGFCIDDNDVIDDPPPPQDDDEESEDDDDDADVSDDGDDADDGEGAEGEGDAPDTGDESDEDGADGDSDDDSDGDTSDDDSDGDSAGSGDADDDDDGAEADAEGNADADDDGDAESDPDAAGNGFGGDDAEEESESGDSSGEDGGDPPPPQDDGEDDDVPASNENDSSEKDDADSPSEGDDDADSDAEGEDDGAGSGEPDDSTPDEAQQALDHFGGHDAPTLSGDDDDDLRHMSEAVKQAEHFDAPSSTCKGTNVSHWKNPDMDRKYNCFDEYYGQAYRSADEVPQPVNLNRPRHDLRKAFADNKKSRRSGPRRSGRPVSSLLPSVATGNRDVFARKGRPGKRDYFICMTIDVSGSTAGDRIMGIVQMAITMGDLLSSVPDVTFALYAHDGDIDSDGLCETQIAVLKDEHDPWTGDVRDRVAKLSPAGVNLDGHTVEYMRKRCDESSATDKFIVYVTDGAMPMSNYDDELAVLEREIKTCKKKNYHIVGIGWETDSPSRHGLPTIQVFGPEDIKRVIDDIESRLIG